MPVRFSVKVPLEELGSGVPTKLGGVPVSTGRCFADSCESSCRKLVKKSKLSNINCRR